MTDDSGGPLDGARAAAPYASPADLRAALLGHGLLVETRTEGLYHRSGEFEDVLQSVERYAAAQRDVIAPRRWFPPVMSRAELVLTDYLRSFPDLVGSLDVFTGSDSEHRALLAALDAGEDWTRSLSAAEVVMSSSACHSLYDTLPREVPAGGLLVECCGFVFRHEPSLDPARMLSFRQYEFVRVGTPAEALAHRDLWTQKGHGSLRDLGLPVRLEVANDPFFGRVGRMLAANQLEAALKFEIVVDLTEARETAIASTNYHEDHFGAPFGLTTPDGGVAHSACIGYGLERITLALFAVHGLRVDDWPTGVRTALGC